MILESLACGTPTVSFDLGGIGELVADGDTGVLVPDQDVDAMTATVLDLVDRPGVLAGFRGPCREQAERNHQQETAARRHMALYRDAVESHRRTPA